MQEKEKSNLINILDSDQKSLALQKKSNHKSESLGKSYSNHEYKSESLDLNPQGFEPSLFLS